MSEIAVLASYLTDLEQADIPENVQEAAALHILDSVGTALGAVGNPQILEVSRQWLKNEGTADTSVWGQNRKTTLSTAVFLNAMMGHTQEMDDVHTNSKTHIGTVVVPAAWGLAQSLGSRGSELLVAVVCGYEAMSRIGMAFGVSSHRNKGWHVTATAGTFGAAAACAKLLGLNAEQTTCALGLAGAQSFGTWAFLGDGASCKVLNPARAAQMGLEAALLAKAGMTGPEHILTAEDGGLLRLMSDEADVGLVTEGLGQVWQTLYMDNKPYPSCRSTHCAIDAALALAREHRLKAEEIDHIVVETYLVGAKQCGISQGSLHPKNAVNAKFSTPYTVACAILYGEVSLRQFRQEAIDDPAAQALLNRISVESSEEFTRVYPNHWGCRVNVFKKDGTVCSKQVNDASGSVDNPLTERQVQEKAVGLMQEACGENARQTAQMILNIAALKKVPEI